MMPPNQNPNDPLHSTGLGAPVLKNELARQAFFDGENDPLAKLCWVNTVCLSMLVVGIAGIERVLPFVPQAMASTPTEFQIQPPVARTDKTLESTPPEESTAPEEGSRMELPRVPEPLKFEGFNSGRESPPILDFPPARSGEIEAGPGKLSLRGGEGGVGVGSGKPRPEVFTGRGKRGNQGYVPEPDILDMPRALQDDLPRGRVSLKLGFKVSGDGKITEIHVDQSSGYPRLDRFILEWYKRKGTFVGGNGERVFVETLSLQLPE